MFSLNAYFDETGSDQDPNVKIVGMACCLHRSDYWARFEIKWRAALEKADIEYFHMNEFAHSRGQFKTGWKGDEPKRQAFYGDLWNIIEELEPIVWGCFFPLADYKRLLTEDQRRGLVDSYF